MLKDNFPAISRQVWDMKYRLRGEEGDVRDITVEDSWQRVAKAASEVEASDVRAHWEARFLDALQGFEFIPGGRILAGAGSGRQVTLFNCFVMDRIGDDLSSIFKNVEQAAITMQRGGGIGHDFSTLRPKGAPVEGVGAEAAGPVSFMNVWDAMCQTMLSAGARRGAMMGTLHCSHPDIERFIDAKADPQRLRMFNLSVLISDAFMQAVRADSAWPLTFEGKTYRTVCARDLWQRIMRANYDYAEPGVIFIDRINALNNLNYCETISATNPCGEQPLPPFGACLLGSINLASLVRNRFRKDARLDMARLRELVAVAVRFLDNIIDISPYPLPEQKAEALTKRRMGLGVTGLADALIMCGATYGDEHSLALADGWLRCLKETAYRTSAELASERGVFPAFRRAEMLAAPGIAVLAREIRDRIAAVGLRNGLLTSVAPTGTISLFAGNISSGIEPVFGFSFKRRILNRDGSQTLQRVEDYAYRLFRAEAGERAPLPKSFVKAAMLSPAAHLAMQSVVQRHIDSAISKTVNCPRDIGFADFERIYLEAYELGLKGCTTFRPNPITGSVLEAQESSKTASQDDSCPPDGDSGEGASAGLYNGHRTGRRPRPSKQVDKIAGELTCELTAGDEADDCDDPDIAAVGAVCPACRSDLWARKEGCAVCFDCASSACE